MRPWQFRGENVSFFSIVRNIIERSRFLVGALFKVQQYVHPVSWRGCGEVMWGSRTSKVFYGPAVVVFLLFCFSSDSLAGNYLTSAHGSSTLGVCRDGICSESAGGGQGYARGNCANCHEQHASIAGSEPIPVDGAPAAFALLTPSFSGALTTPYVQADVLCFYCHGGSDQLVNNMLNPDYAEIFGGYTGGPQTIMATFNQYSGSAGANHNLLGVQEYAAANFSFFDAESDPCSACHNVHLAKDYKNHPSEIGYSAISRPTDHFNLWGDELGEYMSDHTGTYLSPYYYNSTTVYEPGGIAISNGSTSPDYNTFCLDCHGPSAPAPIVSKNRGVTLKTINWPATGASGDAQTAGDKHGVNVATGAIDTRAPYSGTSDLVLSCLDCHEAHGSEHTSMIRRSINGVAVDDPNPPIGNDDGDRGWQCRQCHLDDYELKTPTSTNYNKWSRTHHGGSLNPYKSTAQVATWAISANAPPTCTCHAQSGSIKLPIKCENCHGHNAWVPDSVGVTIDAGTANERVIPPPFFLDDGSSSVNRRTF